VYEDRGANTPLIELIKPQKRGFGRVFGLGVAWWPHPNGGTPQFSDTSLSLAGFLISTPRFDETAFDFWL